MAALGDDRKVGGIFKNTREKGRKRKKREKRYVTFARELICDIYLYTYTYTEKKKAPGESSWKDPAGAEATA